MTVLAEVKEWWPLVIVAAPGCLSLLKSFRDERNAKREYLRLENKDKADLITIAQEAAGAVIQNLRDEAQRLQDRLQQVEEELANFRKEHISMMANKDAEIALLKGEKASLEAQISSLKRILDANGIEYKPNAPSSAAFKVEAGHEPTAIEPMVAV